MAGNIKTQSSRAIKGTLIIFLALAATGSAIECYYGREGQGHLVGTISCPSNYSCWTGEYQLDGLSGPASHIASCVLTANCDDSCCTEDLCNTIDAQPNAPVGKTCYYGGQFYSGPIFFPIMSACGADDYCAAEMDGTTPRYWSCVPLDEERYYCNDYVCCEGSKCDGINATTSIFAGISTHFETSSESSEEGGEGKSSGGNSAYGNEEEGEEGSGAKNDGMLEVGSLIFIILFAILTFLSFVLSYVA
mmetsp:Transcript_23399/g.59235  ORF Transcript_23399/g.59235 Transcript_23399/m.59235 type:complete len:248 (-) Transcript_23399:97-840(-)